MLEEESAGMQWILKAEWSIQLWRNGAWAKSHMDLYDTDS